MAASLLQKQSLHSKHASYVCTCSQCPSHSNAAGGAPGHGYGHGIGVPVLPYPYPINNLLDNTAHTQRHVFSSSAPLPQGFYVGAGNGDPDAKIKHTHATWRKESLVELENVNKSDNNEVDANGAPKLAVNDHTQRNGHGYAPPLASPISATSTSWIPGGYSSKEVPEIKTSSKTVNAWTLRLPIPIPHTLHSPVFLDSVMYTVRYASCNAGMACVQTDIVLGMHTLGKDKDDEEAGIITDYKTLEMYNYDENDEEGAGLGYGPLMVSEARGKCLTSVPGFKAGASVSDGWSHYLDHQRVRLGAQLPDQYKHGECQLYLFFHVYEYPEGGASEVLRSLSVDVSVGWREGGVLEIGLEKELVEVKEERAKLEAVKKEVEDTMKRFEDMMNRAKVEGEMRVKEGEEIEKEIKEMENELEQKVKKAREEEEQRLRELEEQERKANEEHLRRMKEEEDRMKSLEEAERKAEEKLKIAREEEERMARDAERRAKEEAERMKERARSVPSVSQAPSVADEKMQEHIASVAARLGQKCKNGYAWEKKTHGYKCSGGGHFISFKDLGMH